MELTVIPTEQQVSLLKLDGRLDPHAAQRLRARLRSETIGKAQPAIVDICEVRFITSVGIGALVECAQALKSAGYGFVVVSREGRVDTVMRKTGIDRIIPFAESVEEAMSMVGVNH